MALTQITTNGIKDGTITGTDLTTNIDLVDNQKLRLGTSSDKSEIYNDGDDLFINHTEAGYLQLQGNYGVLIQRHNGTENLLRALSNGAVELYYDNSKKFETTSGGSQLYGTFLPTSDASFNLGSTSKRWGTVYSTDFQGNGSNLTGINTDLVSDTSPQLGGDLDTNSNKITLPDSNGVTNSIVFGNSSDMKMYHDGTHSVIKDSGTGNLQLAGSLVQITNAAISASMLVATEGGSVELYHNGSKKLETTSGGIDLSDQLQVDGTVFATGGLKINSDSTKLRLGASDDLQIFHDGFHSKISNSTGYLVQRSNQYKLSNVSEDHTYIKVPTHEGGVELYYDNSKTLWTHGSGINLKGGNTSDQTELQIYGNEGQDASILLASDDGDDNADNWRMYSQASDNTFRLKNYASGAYEDSIVAFGNGSVELYHNSDKRLETTSTGVTFNGTGSIILPSGTTAQRSGSPNAGEFRFNSSINAAELYNGNQWKTVGISQFTINFLVIGGGGGGGGSFRGGGGGAGALRTSYGTQGGGTAQDTAVSIISGIAISIIVGAGGAGGSGTTGSDGSSSTFSTKVAKGGGGGGRYHTNDGTEDGRPSSDPNGGSGGGGGGAQNSSNVGSGGASGTYGNNGAAGSPSPSTQCGGGGGGAGGAGIVGGGGGTNGDGGSSLASTITGSSVDYAGGGGGGNYEGGNTTIGGGAGAGAGGRGSQTGGNAASANKGSGGGGAGGGTGGNGGSGVIILRLASTITATFTSGVTQSSATVGSDKVYTITATSSSNETVTFT